MCDLRKGEGLCLLNCGAFYKATVVWHANDLAILRWWDSVKDRLSTTRYTRAVTQVARTGAHPVYVQGHVHWQHLHSAWLDCHDVWTELCPGIARLFVVYPPPPPVV